MARRKVLKRRLYTYEQLDKRVADWVKSGEKRYPALYGNVIVEYAPGRTQPGLCIRYVGKKSPFTLASVHHTNVGTLYEVHGIGAGRNKPSVRKSIDLWTRYVSIFTPHDAGQRLYGGERKRYLLDGGVVVPLDDHEVPGIWRTMPRSMQPKAEGWALGGGHNEFHTLPNFTRRCRVFATRLRKALADDGMGAVQLRNHHGWSLNWNIPRGNSLHVCTPPHGTHNGRRLVVQIAVHDGESRRHFHIDGDYATAHSQFIAIEDGKTWREQLRWKCARDAIFGIKEWIIGDIYIPGPG